MFENVSEVLRLLAVDDVSLPACCQPDIEPEQAWVHLLVTAVHTLQAQNTPFSNVRLACVLLWALISSLPPLIRDALDWCAGRLAPLQQQPYSRWRVENAIQELDSDEWDIDIVEGLRALLKCKLLLATIIVELGLQWTLYDRGDMAQAAQTLYDKILEFDKNMRRWYWPRRVSTLEELVEHVRNYPDDMDALAALLWCRGRYGTWAPLLRELSVKTHRPEFSDRPEE